MTATQLQKNLCFKILQKSYPDVHEKILSEVQKGYSERSLAEVKQIADVFMNNAVNDRILFVAVVVKLFHPSLYENDNRDIPLRQGLSKEIGESLGMSKGNTSKLIQQARAWLRCGIDDLRQRTDEFFEQCVKETL